ncbi:MAG: hypothetical protein H6710_05710 [Myxococcales bacterium]|nr:hypothetical protein [Myxococcales bacterium]
MVIPVAGPFLAMPYMSTDEGIVFAAFGGAFQIAGLVMTAFGAAQLGIYNAKKSQSAPPMASRRRLRLMGAATPTYAGAGLSLRF